MTAPSASGYLSAVYSNCATLLANCATWKTLCGASDATEALAYIHIGEMPAEDAERPWASVFAGDDLRVSRIGAGLANEYQWGGNLHLLIELEPSADCYGSGAAGENLAELEAHNRIGALVSEMAALSGSGTYLDVAEFSYEQPPLRSDESQGEATRYYQTVLNIQWGVNA